jgi:hypothetical protein
MAAEQLAGWLWQHIAYPAILLYFHLYHVGLLCETSVCALLVAQGMCTFAIMPSVCTACVQSL